MPTRAEVMLALQGAIRLARLDASGLQYFDRSLDGFWKSFFAALLIAPIHIALTLMSEEALPPSVGGLQLVVVEAIAYALRWLAYPCLMLLVVDVLGRRERYFDLMVPYNWVNVPQIILLVMVAVVTTSGLLPGLIGRLLWIFAFSSILVYQWFVAKVGLGVPGRTAVLLVLLDVAVGLTIGGIKQRLLQG